MKLTQSQDVAINKIKTFINSNENAFILRGAAGTGKTTLCKYIIDIINEIDNIDYTLLSPTGRAARVLSQKTNTEASTIHSHIYTQSKLVEYIQTSRKTDFKTTFDLRHNDAESANIYIIDESSMISNLSRSKESSNLFYGTGNLLIDILSFVYNSSNINHKLIFIGDQAQLPPINCDFSPALNLNLLKEYKAKGQLIKASEHTLMEIVRQNEMNEILVDANFLRTQIDDNNFTEFSISKNSNNCKELNYYDLENQFVRNYKPGSFDNPIMITHSNMASRYKNEWLRKKIFKYLCQHQECADRYRCTNLSYLEVNESLISIHNSYKYNIHNGDSFIVTDVLNNTYEKHKVFRDKNDKKPVELEFVDIIIKRFDLDSNKNIEQTVKVIINSLTSNENNLSKIESNALNAFAAERHKDLYKSKKGRKNKQLKLNIDTDPFIKAFFDDEYRNALQIKYGYSITCHKSQGGEWSDAYIDFTYSSKDSNAPLSQDHFRWAYTALTRGKENIFHVNQNKIRKIESNEPQQIINYKN